MFVKPSIGQLQWIVWVFVFLVLTLSLLPMDGFAQAFVYALLYTTFYAAIIYGNIYWLYPSLYKKGRVIIYIIAVLVFLVVIGIVKSYITLNIYNLFFAKHPETMSVKAVAGMVIGGFMVFLLSFVFRIAIEYFKLKQHTDEMIARKTQAELDLLKSQVQPHFLFNTLNNIYYEAYLEAPRTASLIERLSDIMRYFVDESPKQLVSLTTEIQFLENYIALEKIRIRYDIDLDFIKDCEATISIPPMLLMTFVENIFKHGIDKSSTNNKISIRLIQNNGRLSFITENTVPARQVKAPSTGFGLVNLRKRLVLLYADDFELNVNHENDSFIACLTIPLA
ncbi:sensor histidine kinase [Mucilaginibacter glaciei]|uniref:sensor histidine kinase n=1 Tax=Mucilaginibacter glaciei TaxID=2772109 RepID=UPI001CD111B1|nr:histidine kinase [Mucilaginibacter glaciei]